MSNDNELLKQRKESLLSELESIKYILGEADTTDIPLLDDVIIEETDPSIDYHQAPPHKKKPHTTQPYNSTMIDASSAETSLPAGVLPGQQSLFKESLKSTDTSSAPINSLNKTTESSAFKAAPRIATAHSTGSNSSLAQNPFLPPHVRKRFQESNHNTTSTLNTQVPANHHEVKITPPSPQGSTVKTSYTEQLVDQLIAHHLPKIEAELRQKLLEVVNAHNERVKK